MPMVNVEGELHMAAGDGETSYAKNSRIQEKAMDEVKPVVEKATREVYAALLPRRVVVVDLGCSSGPNTLRFVSEVISTIAHRCSELGQRQDDVELQFFLNDLPANDFNNLFGLFGQFKKLMARNHMGELVNLTPKGLERARKTLLDKGEIYITSASSPSIVKLFRKQFQKDFSVFLKLRREELAFGGQMILTFIARKNEDVLSGEPNQFYGLLAQSLRSLVDKSLVEREKL